MDNSFLKSTLGSRNKIITLSSEESKDLTRSSAHKKQVDLGLSFSTHEGYLYKHVHKMKLFQLGSFNLRFFKIDVRTHQLKIFSSDTDDKPSKTIAFRDIFKVSSEQSSSIIDKGCPWKNVFVLFTMERPFRLYTKTLLERDKWITCFTELVQKQRKASVKQVLQAKKDCLQKSLQRSNGSIGTGSVGHASVKSSGGGSQ
mmetsp:Transcript_4958/g.6062  ORF Transcript_4958/g.6062 Transcript_4958/m.6062 type:complete len:200 (+) Transcript_4958:329-928(+)